MNNHYLDIDFLCEHEWVKVFEHTLYCKKCNERTHTFPIDFNEEVSDKMLTDQEKYDRIIKEITISAHTFHARFNIKPNTVMMNQNDYNDLVKVNNHMIRHHLIPLLSSPQRIQVNSVVDKVSIGYMVDVEMVE